MTTAEQQWKSLSSTLEVMFSSGSLVALAITAWQAYIAPGQELHRAQVLPAMVLVKTAVELKCSSVPKDKSNTSMQRLLSQSSSNTVPQYGLKCISPQNSREIQCPEMKYRLSCKCFLSASHHNNKMSQIFRSHWSIYIIYTKGCPRQHWEFPARQGKGRRWTRSESYERKLKEIRSPEMCGHKLWVGSGGTWCGGAAGFEQWPDPALSHCCWAQTTQQHDVLWSHDRALQTPLAFWTSNWGSPGPLGLYHSLHQDLAGVHPTALASSCLFVIYYCFYYSSLKWPKHTRVPQGSALMKSRWGARPCLQ